MRITFSALIVTGSRALALGGISLGAVAQAQVQPDPTVAAPAEAAAEEIVVTGSRVSRERAVERKRLLPTIADVVASDGIGLPSVVTTSPSLAA